MPVKQNKSDTQFLWIPGEGADPSALARMREAFLLPREPMGEAWFMGKERKIYPELSGDLNSIPIEKLIRPLEEIASGISAFGLMEEWDEWFHYLLGRVLHRAHERNFYYFLELLMTAFMNVYPDGIDGRAYKDFREDALNTLGKSIMDPECWNGENIVMCKILNSCNHNPKGRYGWDRASGDFSSSMFFCLKYLEASQIPAWAGSALAIKSPHWRAQMIVWLVGADEILKGQIQQPSELKGYPSVEWDWSHCIRGDLERREDESQRLPDFIPPENRNAFLETVKRTITEDVYLEWIDSIAQYDYIVSEMVLIPKNFEEIYLRPPD